MAAEEIISHNDWPSTLVSHDQVGVEKITYHQTDRICWIVIINANQIAILTVFYFYLAVVIDQISE